MCAFSAVEKEISRVCRFEAFPGSKRSVELMFCIKSCSQIRTVELSQTETAETAGAGKELSAFAFIRYRVKTG